MSLASREPPDARAKLRVALVIYAAVLLEGTMLATPGPTLDSLAQLSHSTLGEIGIVFTANGLGFMMGALLAGRLYSLLPGNRLMAAAMTTMGLAAFSVPLLGSLPAIVGVFALIGVAVGLIDVGGNTLIVWLYRDDVAPYMNALHLFWGIGAFMAPLLVAQVALSTGDAAASYWLLAGVMIPVALWLVVVPGPEVPMDARPSPSRSVMRRHSFVITMMGLLFFAHVGAELTFGGWIFSYAHAVQIGAETTARVLNSLFWGGLVVGRLLAIPLSIRVSARRFIQIDLLGAALGLGVVAFLPEWDQALWVGTALFGMSIGSIFASCINYMGRHMPITSQVTSVFLIGASLGSMTLPWLAGRLFDSVGPDAIIYSVGSAIVTGLVLFAVIDFHIKSRGPDVARLASR